MKTIKQLLSELPNKSLIFAFGRFNPPTVGHELLISKVEALSKKTSIPYRIYTTATQDKKSNPLSQKDKIKYMEKSFRNAHIYAAKGNIIQLLQSF
jgi:nicotinamide mononucleotide adenylyltransferase